MLSEDGSDKAWCLVQNSRKEYNSDSEKPAPWKWFKGNPNNPYKVSCMSGRPASACIENTTHICIVAALGCFMDCAALHL